MKEYDEFDDVADIGPAKDPVDIKPYIHLVLNNWKKIFLWAFLGSLFGVMIGLSTPKTYTSETIVAPELVTRSSLGGGLNALSSLAGINMNSFALTDAMQKSFESRVGEGSNGLYGDPICLGKASKMLKQRSRTCA